MKTKTANKPQTTTKQTVTLKKDKDCQSCVRFATDDKEAVITNIYVMRPFADDKKTVTVTIE